MSATLGNGTVTFGDSTVQSTAASGGGTKAWGQFSVNYLTGVVTINGSYNISSITRSLSGAYPNYIPYFTINFTNAMANINYSVVGNEGGGTNSGYGGTITLFNNGQHISTTPTTTSFLLCAGEMDPEYCCFAVFN
jgi:hypothetical protein